MSFCFRTVASALVLAFASAATLPCIGTETVSPSFAEASVESAHEEAAPPCHGPRLVLRAACACGCDDARPRASASAKLDPLSLASKPAAEPPHAAVRVAPVSPLALLQPSGAPEPVPI